MLINEETEEHYKDINAIDVGRIEEDEETLIKKERELMKTLFVLQQKHKDINLAYENVIENMKNLIAYQNEQINPNHEELLQEEVVEKEDKEEGEEGDKEGGEHKEDEEGKEDKEDKEGEDIQHNEEQKDSNTKDEVPATQVVEGEEGKKEDNPDNGVQETIDVANQITNEETVPPNKSIIIEETPEETELINQYNTFLKQALKTFNILFLCHSKQEFLNLMNEKGLEMQAEKERLLKQQTESKKKGRRSTTKRRLTNITNLQKTTTPIGEEEEDNDKEVIDKDILNKFMKEMKKNREDFVNGDNKPKYVVKKQ